MSLFSIMSNFKKVLEVEKKYEHSINTARKKSEKNLQKFTEELKIKEEAIKQDYKKELEHDFNKQVSNFKARGEQLYSDAKEEAQRIEKNSNSAGARKILMEAVKNV